MAYEGIGPRVPLSEGPVRETRTDGSKPFYGEDGRVKAKNHSTDRYVTRNAFLDGDLGGGVHIGDGLSHNQQSVNEHTIVAKPEPPTSKQESAELILAPVSGGEQEAEHHAKTWTADKLGGFEHEDPPAKKWIGKAVKHEGRLTRAAKAAGVSKRALAKRWSHSEDPSKRGAGGLGLRFMKGGDIHASKKN